MINVIDPNQYIRENKCKGPVVSPQYFMGKTYNFHPGGLLSEDIFGLDGSPERRKNISWINLECKIIPPMLYDIMSKRIFRDIGNLLSGETVYTIGDDGLLIKDENGEISGFNDFITNIDKVRFSEGEGERPKIVNMLYKNIANKTFFMDKILVISPEYRPVQIDEEKQEVTDDEINTIYRRIIILSNQVKGTSGSLYDVLSFQMQRLVRELLEFIRVKVAKKQGMIRKLMLGKRVDFSARSVVSPNPKLRLGEVGLPLRLAIQLFEPHMIYGLVNSPESKRIPQEFHDEVKKFLGKETSLGGII